MITRPRIFLHLWEIKKWKNARDAHSMQMCSTDKQSLPSIITFKKENKFPLRFHCFICLEKNTSLHKYHTQCDSNYTYVEYRVKVRVKYKNKEIMIIVGI